MALYDTYGPKSSAARQIKAVIDSVTPPNPEPEAPKPQGFDRKTYQRKYMNDYMRVRRKQARAKA